MSYFAVALARGSSGWTVGELDLGRPSDLSDVEEVADLLRDFDTDATVSVLFVEVDDEYLGILRLDEGGDLRVFGSDEAFIDESPIGEALLAEEDRPAPIELPDDDYESEGYTDPPAAPDGVEPIGDADLLTDLGVPGVRLRSLVAAEGKLPSDVTAEICAVLGCADEVEELR